LHSWEGLNEKVYGVAIPNEGKNGIDQLAILVYVRDFDSNNSGRDAHALEILDALKYPEIRFYSNEIEILEEQMILNGSFDFHGNKIEKKITAALKQKDSEWKIQGTFQLNPTDFKIDLPSFLSIKMKDLLEINYSIVLKK
jgi:polyisoprenoid-binding protein YceI